MTRFFKKPFIWNRIATLIAVAVTSISASIFSSQIIIANLANLGLNTPFAKRLSMTAYDLYHFAGLYSLFILLAFMIAFQVAGFISKKLDISRAFIFVGAGFIAIFVMLFLMQRVFFGVPIVGGAREGFGHILQLVAGGLGGWVFARLTRKNKIDDITPPQT